MFARHPSTPRSGAGHLEWRIRLFGAGAIIGMVGIFADVRWMIWIAIAVLVAGFLLRFLGRDGLDEEGGSEDEGSEPL